MSGQLFKTFYQFPEKVKAEFKVIPWLQVLVYLPLLFESITLDSLAVVIACHCLLFPSLFRVYWVKDKQVVWYFLFALTLSFFSSFYSLASIAFYAITILVAMAHPSLKIRLSYVLLVVVTYLTSAWLQSYQITTFLVGLFFTLVNGISVSYQIKALYQQLAIKQTQEEVRLTAASNERERIAHDLHDVLGQSLAGISLKAELALKVFDKSPSTAQQQLSEILQISRNTLQEVRAAVSGYWQSTIRAEVISARVGFAIRGIKFSCDIADITLEPPTEQVFSWVIREASTNIMRHSKANCCQLNIRLANNKLTLIISDDGSTVDSDQANSSNTEAESIIGTGILSMRQRCHGIGATFFLCQQQGYKITVTKELFMIRLLIVEDQAIVLDALTALLNLEDDLTVVATAMDGKQAIEHCKKTEIDIVISDIEMPIMDGLALAQQLHDDYPKIKTIILTTFSKQGYVKRSQKAKVNAYLLKDSPSDLLVETIKAVNSGKIIIAPELISEVWRNNIEPLNKKEQTLLIMAHQGLKSTDIAKKMNLSPGTVRNYAHSACQKLGAKNRIEAATIAYRMGWL